MEKYRARYVEISARLISFNPLGRSGPVTGLIYLYQVSHANLEALGWIRNQFDAELIGGSLITAEDETSIDISSDTSLKIRRIPDQVSPRILNQCTK